MVNQNQFHSQRWKDDADINDGADYLARITELIAAQGTGYRQRNMDMLQLKTGHHVLDLGCGLGDDLHLIAPIVGNTGRLVGLDHNEEMLKRAEKRAAEAGFSIEFYSGNIEQMEFSNNSFDAVRSARVFQHLADPIQGLKECIRVTKPGGHIAISDPDWDTLVVDTNRHDIFNRIRPLCVEESLKNARIGRQHYRNFIELGLEDVQVGGDVITFTDYAVVKILRDLEIWLELGVAKSIITQDEAQAFRDDLEQQYQASGSFFQSLTIFTVSGTKPKG
jgi:ubiquinone/menaquinone biosynthesis C-methylase UbiE